jgi:hypothetical protein
MNPLKDFFEAERKRVFAPDAFFTQRVMTRLEERRSADAGIWEIVPTSSRPVLAFALMLILCFVLLEVFVPQEPERGMVEAFLEPEQSPVESFLYSEPDLPSHQEVLQQVIALEEEQ